MRIDLKEDVISLTDFARNTKEHARELAHGERARILTHNGKAAAVVLSLDAFERMSHDAEEYQMDLRLREALEKYSKGDRGVPLAEALGRIRERGENRRPKSP